MQFPIGECAEASCLALSFDMTEETHEDAFVIRTLSGLHYKSFSRRKNTGLEAVNGICCVNI